MPEEVEAASPVPVVHDRGSAFSYECRACRRCCFHKHIQLNAYEIARLSRHRGCTTSEVISRYTVGGGTALATRDDGACVFLGAEGCTVHAARPLACRLYPLGRVALDDGREIFIEHAPHPETEGVYAREGTVEEFLTAQGVEPYLTAAERYYAIFQLLVPGSREPRSGARLPEQPDLADAREFIDADQAVGSRGAHFDASELMEAHLAILQGRARELAGAPSPGKPP
jgi:Fe-S-cluster containining protein